MKKDKKKTWLWVIIVFLVLSPIAQLNQTDSDLEQEPTPTATNTPTPIPTATATPVPTATNTPTPEPTKPPETEEEYKSLCEELYYNDVFFGDDDLNEKYVKLHLYISESLFFKLDAIYNDTFREYKEKYNINRQLYKCCVLRKDTTSYVGEQITMLFNNDYGLTPSDYETGQEIIVYAQVISWSKNNWDGYNDVIIIPKYIEFE